MSIIIVDFFSIFFIFAFIFSPHRTGKIFFLSIGGKTIQLIIAKDLPVFKAINLYLPESRLVPSGEWFITGFLL